MIQAILFHIISVCPHPRLVHTFRSSFHMLCRDLCWLQTEKHDFLVLLSLSAQHKFDT